MSRRVWGASRRVSLRSLLLVGVAIVTPFAGCTSDAPPAGKGDAAALRAPQAPPREQPMPVEEPSPEARLQADNVAEYAKRIEAAMRKASEGPATRPATAPAAVAAVEVMAPKGDSLDPSAVAVSLGPPAVRENPATHPSVPATLPAAGSAERPLPPSFREPAQARPEDVIAQRFRQKLSDDPKALGAHLDYQLLQFLLDRQVPDMGVIATLAPEDREVLSAVMDGLANFRSAVRAEDDALVGRKLRPLMDMNERLRAVADLRINDVVLCTRVDSFGQYEPVASNRFLTGRRHTVIVYCDVENVLSRLNDRRMWESSLQQETALYDSDGKSVWEEPQGGAMDTSHQRRRDFYVARKVTLPANLPAGTYYLKVGIIDRFAQRVAQATLPVQYVDR